MRKMLHRLMFATILLAGCQKDTPLITHVNVLDPDFKTVREIKDVAVLEDLNQIWTNRITVQPSPDQTFTHKVDVSTGTTSARWLYDPRGYATLLSYARMPIYHFNDAEKLRRILIPQQTNVPYSSPAPQVQRQ